MLEESASLCVVGVGFSGAILFVIYIIGKVFIAIQNYLLRHGRGL